VRIEPEVRAFNLDGVVEFGPNPDETRDVSGALAQKGNERRHVNESLQTLDLGSRLGDDDATVTMADEDYVVEPFGGLGEHAYVIYEIRVSGSALTTAR